MKPLTRDELLASVEKFIDWLDRYGELSYDLNDFNSSSTGNFIRKVYYRNKILGAPLAFLALAQETFFPAALTLYAKPHREAIGDAQYAIGFLQLYEFNGDVRCLHRAEHFLDELKKSAVTGYSGLCWGYTYGWQTTDGYWPPRTPVITVTPYGYWAFRKYYELTGNNDVQDVLRSIVRFPIHDLKRITLPDGTQCYSYSPLDRRFVVNANAYRAAMLLDAFKLFGDENYRQEAEISLRFVLASREKNGSWFYEPVGTRDRFIDNFHTCFVLKSLKQCYDVTGDPTIMDAIRKGYDYYRKSLIRPDGLPKHFALQKHNKLRKYEMYDFAEGITLGCLLDGSVDGGFEQSKTLAGALIRKFQLSDGHFVTRVTTLGTVNKVPYHRWPQAQLFNALTRLLLKMK